MPAPRNIGTDPNGPWTIQIVAIDGQRATIGLGRMRERDAYIVADKIEALRTARMTGKDPKPEIQDWLATLPALRLRALIRAGLTDAPQTGAAAKMVPTLAEWFETFLRQKGAELKPRTVALYRLAYTSFSATVAGSTPIDQITPAAAPDWRASLAPRKLSEATIRGMARSLKALFNAAVDQEIIARNPVRKLASASIASERNKYVMPAEAAKVLDQLPSAQSKLIFALARFGGLRVPSETHILTWANVDFEAGRMLVHAPKTGRTRWVPVAPELAPILQDAYDAAPVGAERVVTVTTGVHGVLDAAITRAGIEPWDDQYQTLRRSRETEWLEKYPAHVVAAWMGHSVNVQQKHYAQVTDEHFARAAAPQNAAEKMQPANAAGRNAEPTTPVAPSCAAMRPESPDGVPIMSGLLSPLSYGADDPEQAKRSRRSPSSLRRPTPDGRRRPARRWALRTARREPVEETTEVQNVEDGRRAAAVAVGKSAPRRERVEEAREIVDVQHGRDDGTVAVGVAHGIGRGITRRAPARIGDDAAHLV